LHNDDRDNANDENDNGECGYREDVAGCDGRGGEVEVAWVEEGASHCVEVRNAVCRLDCVWCVFFVSFRVCVSLCVCLIVSVR